MAAPVWSWPASGLAARGNSLAAFGVGSAAGFAAADWTAPTVWPYVAAENVFGTPVLLASGGPPGLAGIVPDAAAGAWALAYDGRLWDVNYAASGILLDSSGNPVTDSFGADVTSPGGAPTLVTTLPSGRVYVGLASEAGGLTVAAVGADGTAWSSSATEYGNWGNRAAWFAAVSGSALFTLLFSGGVASVGTMALPGGATGSISLTGAAALAVPSCLAVAPSGLLAVGGWTTATPLSGCNALAVDPVGGTNLVGVLSGQALLWTAPAASSNTWTQTQYLSGLANLDAVAWVPNGTQLLACSTVSGAVQVIEYNAGVIALAQTLSVSGAAGAAVTSDSLNALVVGSGLSHLTPLTNTSGTWASGTAISDLTGVTAVAIVGTSSGAAAYASGVALLTITGGVWTVGSTTALGFVPSLLAYDTFGTLYAAGASGIAMLSGSVLMASGAGSGGTPTGLVVQAGRIVVSASGVVDIFGQSSASGVALQWSGAVSLGSSVFAAAAGVTVFLAGTGATSLYQFAGTPFTLDTVTQGAVGFWNGSSWTTVSLGVGQNPCAVAFNGASGSAVWATTVQNGLYSISGNGTVLSSGVVAPYAGQSSGVPLGPAALFASGTELWAVTSLPGAAVQLN